MSKPTVPLAAARPGASAAPQFRPLRTGVRAVGSFVPQLTRKAFEKYGFSMASLILDWPRIAGPALARDTVPERLKWPRVSESAIAEGEGPRRPAATLVLRVDPARALDVQYAARQLVERINAFFGYRAVAELRIVQGHVQAPEKPVALPLPAVRRPAAPAVPLPGLAEVRDEALREALARMQKGVARRAAQ